MTTELGAGAAREGQVTNEVNRHKNQSGELQEVIDRIEVRLVNVLTDYPEKAVPSPEKPTLVTLAGQIESSNDTVRDCMAKLLGILERIEI